mgnify:CR=1 FL=1
MQRIEFINNAEQKESIARIILEQLPEWFGLPDSTKEYIENDLNNKLFNKVVLPTCLAPSIIKGLRLALFFHSYNSSIANLYKAKHLQIIIQYHYTPKFRKSQYIFEQ